jgi:hypothetical protein
MTRALEGGRGRGSMDRMNGLDRRIRELRYSARYLVSAYPSVYLRWARRHYAGTGVGVVGPDTEIVIEGFGRSGSTFAVDAFEMAQMRPVMIAHHTHAAAQVIAAARLGIPTIVLVRHPLEVALSHMVRRDISARPPLTAWLRYHCRILPVRDRIVVGATQALSVGIGDMIRQVNERFETSFEVFEPTEEGVARVFEGIERRNRERYGGAPASLARPTREREARKAALRSELERPSLAALRDRSLLIYRELLPSLDRRIVE